MQHNINIGGWDTALMFTKHHNLKVHRLVIKTECVMSLVCLLTSGSLEHYVHWDSRLLVQPLCTINYQGAAADIRTRRTYSTPPGNLIAEDMVMVTIMVTVLTLILIMNDQDNEHEVIQAMTVTTEDDNQHGDEDDDNNGSELVHDVQCG